MKKIAIAMITLLLIGILTLVFNIQTIRIVHGMAADCQLEPTEENYIGVRYKAVLLEDELSETGWVLLFGGNGFTMNGEYQPHFMDLMIKGGWADIYDDPLCSSGFPSKETLKKFSIEFGLSDYEDTTVQDNDIAAWSEDPELFPRIFTNIDSRDPQAPDKIMTVYQVDNGGFLEGREIEVSFVRREVTRLPMDENYFMDPDLEGEDCCKPNSQDDILYRHWVATLVVPSLGVNSSVDFYINADQGDKISGKSALNFMWENYRRPAIESDKFKVIVFDLQVKTTSGEWKNATKFLVDYRTPDDELPLNDRRELVGGYRKVNYGDYPAMEASFGYGYADYLIDGDPNDYESTDATKGVIDLEYLEGTENCDIKVVVVDSSGFKISGASVYLDESYKGNTDPTGECVISSIFPGYHILEASKSGHNVSTIAYVESGETENITLILESAPEHGRLLFDEAHSEWISIEGNYKEFANSLRMAGHVVEHTTFSPITYDILRDYDVYIVGTAWGSFTSAEVDAITQFVSNGGGLFLTGLGWSWVNPTENRTLESYPMNLISRNFGIEFLEDSICDPTDNYGSNPYTPVFHETITHLITWNVVRVGGPICPSPLKALGTGSHAVVFGDEDAYSNGGNYPVGSYPPVVMATAYNQGRVVCLGHEGYLSTDDYDSNGVPNINDFDNLQLGLNIIYWLVKKNLPEFLKTDLNQDGTVNIVDISIVAMAFGTKLGDDNWNEVADLDKNEEINIIDISTVAMDYGKTV